MTSQVKPAHSDGFWHSDGLQVKSKTSIALQHAGEAIGGAVGGDVRVVVVMGIGRVVDIGEVEVTEIDPEKNRIVHIDSLDCIFEIPDIWKYTINIFYADTFKLKNIALLDADIQ